MNMTSIMMNRRHLLRGSAGAAALWAVGWMPSIKPARASNGFEAAIAEFTGGVTPERGRVMLTIAETVDNGSNVPLSVSVDSEMTTESHVEEVAVFAQSNPLPEVANFRFTARSGKAEVATRVRLASSQEIVAVARMNDGTLFMDSRQVEVTVGGCVG